MRNKLLIAVLLIFLSIIILRQFISFPVIELESDATACSRIEPYPMQPEFERALSLIIQRLEQRNKDKDFIETIQEIKNCLYISYSDDVDKYGAEGLFNFDENSTNERLNILVSNSYKANDDILTALLLIHEVTHAGQFVLDIESSCFDLEAQAFFNQIVFFTALNKAEQDSLVARATVGGSREVDSLFDFMEAVIKLDRNDPYGSILKLIKDDPFYQEQCSRSSSNSTANPTSPPVSTTKPQPTVFREDITTCTNRAKTEATTCVNQCLQKGNSDLDVCKSNYPTDLSSYTRCGDNAMAVSKSCMSNCTQQFNAQWQKCL